MLQNTSFNRRSADYQSAEVARHEQPQRSTQVQNSALPRLIAIVDDDTYARDGMNALVESYGYLGARFATTEEYLASNIVDKTACLILDVHLPGMNGPDLQDRLLADGYRIPIVFVTGAFDEAIRTRVLRAGALCYLSKPCSENALIDCLKGALDSGSGAPWARTSG